MRTLNIVIAILFTSLLAATCDDPKNGPAGPSPSPQTTSSSPVLTGLELTGQTTLAPGATSEFTLIAVFSDGSRNDVTAAAQWSINNSTYVTSLGQGRFRAVANGEATFSARYSNRNISREIVVVPDGTFRVTGRIVEDDGVSPVPNAHIRVRDADETGPQTDADESGYYRLYGVKRNVDLVVTRPGYTDTERKNLTIDRHTTVNIQIPLAGPRMRVEGTYTATFNWSNCSTAFPADLRQRVYTAVVKQSDALIEVRFIEPSFVHNSANRGDLMEGRVTGTGMSLFADNGYYYYYYGGAGSAPSLIELLPDNRRLMSWGTAVLTQSGNRFSGALQQGGTQLTQLQSRGNTYVGSCSVGQLTFTPR
ncbi:MAG TPA: carboxypeptidase-like regulatory domain-containing protein [Vicinamibacterales bacterium]|nr:carboxypeptidase-like regulatory domain-containing protein [Vicinamibacterales bacterium]